MSWGITTKYLITSDYHMMRARAIATVVFGIQGIAVTPLEGFLPERQELVSALDSLLLCTLIKIFTNVVNYY